MTAVLPDSDSYRDARPGAEARRDRLLRENRAALAMQSLELRRIYVRRLARVSAGGSIMAGSVLVAIAAASATARDALSGLFPGRLPAIAADLMFLTPLAGALVYFIARALGEERFTEAMTRAVRPGADAFDDLDRLAVGPTARAAAMADRVRAGSVAAVIGAAAVAAPLLTVLAIALAEGAWQSPAIIEEVAWRAGAPLAQTSVASLVFAAAWLAIAQTSAAHIGSRARRSAAVLGGASAVLTMLGLASSGPAAVFLWAWAAWSAGAAGGLVWASARVGAEDRVSRGRAADQTAAAGAA